MDFFDSIGHWTTRGWKIRGMTDWLVCLPSPIQGHFSFDMIVYNDIEDFQRDRAVYTEAADTTLKTLIPNCETGHEKPVSWERSPSNFNF